MRGFWLLFLISLFALLPEAWAEKQLYMMAATYAQETDLSKKAIAASWFVDSLWNFGQTAAYYSVTGEPISALGYLGYQYAASVPLVQENVRLQMEYKSWRERQKFLQEVAEVDGVSDLHVFTAGHMKNGNSLQPKLFSNSVIFVESEKAPPQVKGKEWIAIKKDENAMIRLSLKIQGEEAGTALEIPLKAFIAGKEVDPAIREEWATKIKDFYKGVGFFDRHITHHSANTHLQVESLLVLGDKQINLGEVASGDGVQKLLGIHWRQRAVRAVRNTFSSEPRAHQIGASHSVVYANADKHCSHWFKRFIGKEYIRHSP